MREKHRGRSMADDYDEAERRIAEAKASGADELDLRSLDIERLPDSLGMLSHLKTLDLRGCQTLTDVRAVARLTELKALRCGWDSEARNWFDQSFVLSDIRPLSDLTGLQQLDLSWCRQLTDVSMLSTLTGLQQLNLCDSMALPVGPQDLPLTWWSELETLYANRLINAPGELGSEDRACY
jgi:Leucine-rich repeat (LRR) protein